MLSTSLVFRIPQYGGVARGAVQRNTILFPLKAYSLWNLRKAEESVRWRCTTRHCWLNCRSTLQRNGHNFIGLDGDFIMTTHSLTSRITSCSFSLNLTLSPYSPNLAPCNFFLFPSLKTELRGIRFEISEAVLKKQEAILKDLTKNGLHRVFEEWQQRWVLWKIPCRHWAWAIKYLWKKNQSVFVDQPQYFRTLGGYKKKLHLWLVTK